MNYYGRLFIRYDMEIIECEKNKFWYRCKSGEGVFGVAKKFNVSVYKLIKDNGLVKGLFGGELLIIESGNLIKITAEDSPQKIYETTGRSAEELKRINGVQYLPLNIYLSY